MSTEDHDPPYDATGKVTDGDVLATLTRAGLVMIGPLGSLLGEFVPSASERQTQRSLRTLERKFEDLREIVTTEMWMKAQATEAFDAAFVRTLHASQETAQEEKREFLWLGLINGWVRPEGDTERHRFLRLVSKYALEHFELLIELQQ
ncbi:hypothetical protein [Pseudoclavibacter helvolus]|uniref:hypothetical protein n=1 Tax=Pseudoclavibacter helvolus TaxID=255205 RepID=UPI00083858C6|nr:hypothetical protein [Pseudoclavibacter helvolus]